MTVGACGTLFFGDGITPAGLSCPISGGMLSETTFSLAGANYNISTLVGQSSDGTTQESIYFAVNEGAIIGRNDLVLQLGSREFAFSDAGFISSRYFWNSISPNLTWSASDTVSVKLCVNE